MYEVMTGAASLYVKTYLHASCPSPIYVCDTEMVAVHAEINQAAVSTQETACVTLVAEDSRLLQNITIFPCAR